MLIFKILVIKRQQICNFYTTKSILLIFYVIEIFNLPQSI